MTRVECSSDCCRSHLIHGKHSLKSNDLVIIRFFSLLVNQLRSNFPLQVPGSLVAIRILYPFAVSRSQLNYLKPGMKLSMKSSPQQKQISIVLVNYKTRYLTSVCLDLLREHLDLERVEVWVVDNNSADDSTEYLRSVDWIHLIERQGPEVEKGFIAHGEALDLALEQISTPYMLCIHTDTLIRDGALLDLLLDAMHRSDQVAGVGALYQVHKKLYRRTWRMLKKGIRYYYRKVGRLLGLTDKPVKLYYETYIKSFCALWRVDLIRSRQLRFAMDDLNPGYAMQQALMDEGFRFVILPTRKLFRYLDHVQSGTLVEMGRHQDNPRRTKAYEKLLKPDP